eukprot:510316-Pelagomonas_calceolata.AAC.3
MRDIQTQDKVIGPGCAFQLHCCEHGGHQAIRPPVEGPNVEFSSCLIMEALGGDRLWFDRFLVSGITRAQLRASKEVYH